MTQRKKNIVLDLLNEKLEKNPVVGRGISRLPQFLALQEEIEDALSHGWNAKDIWRVLHEKGLFNGQYNCFVIYVRSYTDGKRHAVLVKQEDSQEKRLSGPATDEVEDSGTSSGQRPLLNQTADQTRPTEKARQPDAAKAKDFKHSNSVTPEDRKRYFGELNEPDKNK